MPAGRAGVLCRNMNRPWQKPVFKTFVRPPTQTQNRIIANTAITTRSVESCRPPVRRFIEPKQFRVRSQSMKFHGRSRWMKPLSQKCGAPPIRHVCNHSRCRRDERRQLSGQEQQGRDRRLPYPWLEVPRLIGRAGRLAQLSGCFPPGKCIESMITAGRFPAATRSIFTWRPNKK